MFAVFDPFSMLLLPHLTLLLLGISISMLRNYYEYFIIYHNYVIPLYCLKFGKTSTKFIEHANVIMQSTCLRASKCVPIGLGYCNYSFISMAICALCLHKPDCSYN